MIQTIILLLLLLGGAAIASANSSMLHQPLPVILPGLQNTSVTYLRAMAAGGIALAVLWLAGMIEPGRLRVALHRQGIRLRANDEVIVRMKSAAYDMSQPVLADVRVRLEEVDRGVQAIGARTEHITSTLDRMSLRESRASLAKS